MNTHVIKKPLITEKTMRLANEENTYTFWVDVAANKHQLKQTIEELYDVTVENINTITKQREVQTTGRRRLTKEQAKKKKALVRIAEGQTIDLFDVSE